MKYTYKLKTKEGVEKKGEIEAPDKFSAAKSLRVDGAQPISISEAKVKKTGISVPFIDSIFNKIKLHEKIIFTRNLSGMLSAGLSLYRALVVLEKQTKNEKFRSILNSLIKDIDKGGTLSEGMSKYPKVFSTLFVSMVRAGEESGKMSDSLKEIGLNLQKTYDLNKKIKGAIMYPSIIVGAIFLIGIFMMIFVVPVLTSTFKELNIELPASTKFIIFISDSLSKSPLLTLGLVFLLFIGLFLLFKSKFFKKYFDLIIFHIPVVGEIVKEVNSARTARTLSSLLISGVDMTKGLIITGEVLQNKFYKDTMQKAVVDIQKGITLSSVFKERVNLYPIMVGEMIEVGEETGKLSNMLVDIAVFYESEVDNKTKDLSTIIEPVLMILIGAAVGFFAISMISPMYSLMDSI
ncbi:MAG: type II secretion system F family protein [Candidatus Pacebacteria bacterium]|nr:type II secretion system F family protein [Candidatus Paceibacterota bacterium]MBP9772601.1 type II secretion system F family protein [Candidatus Paceibacterota bacterium]